MVLTQALKKFVVVLWLVCFAVAMSAVAYVYGSSPDVTRVVLEAPDYDPNMSTESVLDVYGCDY